MAFSRFVDEQFVTEKFPGEAETVNGITDFRKDKLKGKLRQRLPLRATCRPEMFKRIIYKGEPARSVRLINCNHLYLHCILMNLYSAVLIYFPKLLMLDIVS